MIAFLLSGGPALVTPTVCSPIAARAGTEDADLYLRPPDPGFKPLAQKLRKG